MHNTPAIIIGMAGVAFLLGSLAPAAIEARGSATIKPAPKGDLLVPPRPAEARHTVSVIEVIGLSQATVVFKGRDGSVLFQADSATGTTAVAKNVDLPAVTLKEEPSRPAAQTPAPSEQRGTPPTPNPRKKTVGCEAPLSALVRNEAAAKPGLCLAGALPTNG
jgi:hypothetical protein